MIKLSKKERKKLEAAALAAGGTVEPVAKRKAKPSGKAGNGPEGHITVIIRDGKYLEPRESRPLGVTRKNVAARP